MEPRALDGALFLSMVTLGHQNLEANKEVVNSLNVFPVPDGDTGTNMSLSLGAGVEELKRSEGQPISKMAEVLSKGLLMGARGNSGVILSQLMRGFAKAVSRMEEVDAKGFAEALQHGVQTAYQAVVKPVEGTILTVAKDAAKGALSQSRADNATLVDVMKAAVTDAEASLARTPDLLPVLKQANVVDSGGQGLVFIYRGFLAALAKSTEYLTPESNKRQPADYTYDNELQAYPTGPIPHGMPAPSYRSAVSQQAHEQEFGYCTEFIVRVDPSAAEETLERNMRESMMPHGNSLLVVASGDIVKVHVHAEHPGRVLETAMTFGPLIKIKIDNMTEQHHNLTTHYGQSDTQEIQGHGTALVTVASGEGLQEVFSSIGVARIVPGGQTSNPSTEDLLNAVESTHADHVYLLPNNSNILMAAQQASQLAPGRISVIPTRSIPQGIAAALVYDPTRGKEDNEKRMGEAITRISSGAVTRAVRNTQFQARQIAEGDYLGLQEGEVVAVSSELQECLRELFRTLLDDSSEIATLFYGEDISQAEAEEAASFLRAEFPDCEFETHYGGQPLYPFLISVE